MNWKRIDRIVSACVFVYALVLYVMTVAPTASFWDAGEFIAIAHGLQVSHPPGAPFYMLVGRLFSMFVPIEFVALAVNMMSVLASALTVLLTYRIIVRLVQEWQDNTEEWASRVTAMVGGVVGACTFAVTDSFWFNAVEAEVYAMSMLFTAVAIWLIMRWSDYARQEKILRRRKNHSFGLEANRILILVAYLMGLAIGVHLLSLLTLFFIALIVFFVAFDREEWDTQGVPDWRSFRRWRGIAVTGLVATVIFLLIYPGLIQKLPGLAGETDWPLTTLFGVIGVVILAVYYSQKNEMQVMNLVTLCLLMIVIGYSTYALIFIRSAADPPIDENDPQTAEAIVSYLEREQYGQTPLLQGNSYNNRTGRVDVDDEKFFPRRHSSHPPHMRVYSRYNSDFEFFLKYQVGHMFVRYFQWNFVGKESDIQDSRSITGIPFIDGPPTHYVQTPSERASRNKYFALPLLLGFLGMMYHFYRDWRRALCVLVLFLVTGIGIILYLNQSPMQPRERDYSYVASFFAFSLWVGVGATGVLQLIGESLRGWAYSRPYGTIYGISVLLFLIVPGWMAVENYDDHDRSGRYIALDYAHNMLMSVEKDAVLFTNGDNDTFPLWYAQEVEGVRRDVRVANLSLLNTPWYVRQLRDQHSRDSAPLPISIKEENMDNFRWVSWTPQTIELPVDKEEISRLSEVSFTDIDLENIESPMRWELEGRIFGEHPDTGEPAYGLYAADSAVLDILVTNAQQGWARPIYFAMTVSPDGMLGLNEYFQLEGKAFRVLPIRNQDPGFLGRVDVELTQERLRQFRFTNLNNPDVYYDESIRRLVSSYRNVFAHTAQSLTEAGRAEEALELLDMIMEKVPFGTIPGDPSSFVIMSRAYLMAGDTTKSLLIAKEHAEPYLFHYLDPDNRLQADERILSGLIQGVYFAYIMARDYEAAADFQNRLDRLLGDARTPVTPEDIRQGMEGVGDTLEDKGEGDSLVVDG